jgi:RimJ/RimL family protein N-acetyltransferase
MSRDIATIHTDRLLLRPLVPGDAAAIVAGVGNYDVSKWLSVVPFPYSEADARAFLGSPAAQARLAWGICDDEGLQGVVSIDGEFGYWLNRRAWGRGYATEAGRAAVDAAFADPTRAELGAGYMIGNDRSAQVLAKLGFTRIGTTERMFRAFGQTAPAAVLRLTRAEWRRERGLSLRPRWSIARPSEMPEAQQ